VSNLDPTPVRPFGHGLSYTTFTHTDLRVEQSRVPTDGAIVARCRVTNTGDRAGADVVQLYATDLTASVTRPVVQLLGYARVRLEPGHSAEVVLDVPTHRLAFTDRRNVRVVEPGCVPLFIGTSCADPVLTAEVELTGPAHEISTADRRLVRVDVSHD
jgi:hypothetical protein